MNIKKPAILLPSALYLLLFSGICISSRLPINEDTGKHQQTISNIPLSLIGTWENVTYWQESTVMNQTDARNNCERHGLQLMRLRNKSHLDFLILNGVLQTSWTDAYNVYPTNFYRPDVPSTIPIVHFTLFALEIEKSLQSLYATYTSQLRPSVCTNDTNPTPIEIEPAVIPVKKQAIAAKESIVVPEGNYFPFMYYIGSYKGYHYFQNTDYYGQEYAKLICNMFLGTRLATFKTKAHFDYVIERGVTDGSWTGYTSNLTLNEFKWNNGAPISHDIPLHPYPKNLGLIITKTGQGQLRADINRARPSLCMLYFPWIQNFKF